MNVLADLLEVTATCIADLVKETREILEDHGHDTGAAPVRFTTSPSVQLRISDWLRPSERIFGVWRRSASQRLASPITFSNGRSIGFTGSHRTGATNTI